ncbi:hypothetical protein MBLNU230_g2275t1 [Neophaeotheca triangularis]
MESVSRISSMLETARDLTLEAARDAGPRRSAKPLPAAQIKKLLDSRNEREVLDGLRRVIAMQYASPPQPTLPFFAAVLKTLSNPYPSTRPLVYTYLLHHAEEDPDTALLSINTIQKSLSDSNPRVRAMALKTMAGIKVPVIGQIVNLAIKKGTGDMSPIVRKAAALACVKCVRLDSTTRPQVEEYIATLLQDKQYYVAGAAVQAFMEVCPERLDLIHPNYRTLCKQMVDMDEWGQLALLRLMTTYARRCFPRRTKRVRKAQTRTAEAKATDFYEDLEPQNEPDEADFEEVEELDPDLSLLLNSSQPLLSSRNSAVIMSAARLYLYLSPKTHLPLTVGPLIALLRSPQEVIQVALSNIVHITLTDPQLFAPHYRHFLIRSTESPHIWQLKLEMLTLIFPNVSKDIQSLILAELEHFSRSHDSQLVRESVRAIGRCAQTSDARTSHRCLSLLLKQVHSPDQNLVGEAIEVVRHLIQRSPDEHQKTVTRLAKNLDSLTSPTARASIIWLVGEFSGPEGSEGIAPDVLRILIKSYVDESEEVKGQIILLAAKLYLHHLNAHNSKQKALDNLNSNDNDPSDPPSPSPNDPDTSPLPENHPVAHLYTHVLLLARYTPSYPLRDRARFLRNLLSTPSSTDLASLLLLAPKPIPQAPSPSESRRGYALGSASLVLGPDLVGLGGARGYEGVAEWVTEGEEPDARLRNVAGGGGGEKSGGVGGQVEKGSASRALDEVLAGEERGVASVGGGVKGKGAKTLDDWLDESGSEEGSEYETESEYEEESEESESESESEEDEKAGLVK